MGAANRKLPLESVDEFAADSKTTDATFLSIIEIHHLLNTYSDQQRLPINMASIINRFP
jgi:hypothetical protein